ncbi:MAG: hypothetical protein ABIO02_03890, partial [Patescibacteria group bacterium]
MINKKSTHYKVLKNRWEKKHSKVKLSLWKKHGDALSWLQEASRQVVVGSIASFLLLTAPITSTVFSQLPTTDKLIEQNIPQKELLKAALKNILPQEVTPLSEEQEKNLGDVLSQSFHIKVSAVLDGKRLNRSYGLIGKEQHLARYPGDTIASHFNT